MNNQLSWSLSDEVAPYFNNAFIRDLCALIDEKAEKGLKYSDLKEILLNRLQSATNLNDPSDLNNIHRRAYEFARYY